MPPHVAHGTHMATTCPHAQVPHGTHLSTGEGDCYLQMFLCLAVALRMQFKEAEVEMREGARSVPRESLCVRHLCALRKPAVLHP
jgi:hypothetical protein